MVDSGAVLSDQLPGSLVNSPQSSSGSVCYGYGPNSNISGDTFGTLRKGYFSTKAVSPSGTEYISYFNQVQQSAITPKFFSPGQTCEGSTTRFGLSCNWLVNTPANISQDQMLTKGDSGGPCFIRATDWQDTGAKFRARELVGINQSAWSAFQPPTTQAIGSSFSVNVSYVRPWIESKVLKQGNANTTQSQTTSGSGVQWLADVTADGATDFIKFQANKIVVSLSNTANQFLSPQVLPVPAIVDPQRALLTYINNDALVDFVYIDANSVSSLITNFSAGSLSVSAQLPTPLPASSPGDWATDALFLAPLTATSTGYDLVRVATNKLIFVPSTVAGFDPAKAKTSPVECAVPGCPGISDNFDVVDLNKDQKLDFVYVHGKTVLVKNGVGDGSFSSGTTITLPDSCDAPSRSLFIDYNDDGWVDYLCLDSMQVKVFFGAFGGKFLAPVITTFEFKSDWYNRAELIDYNNDGFLDIGFFDAGLVRTSTSGTLPFYARGNFYLKYGSDLGDGTFATARMYRPDNTALAWDAIGNGAFWALDYFDTNSTQPRAITASNSGTLWVSRLTDPLVFPFPAASAQTTDRPARPTKLPLWKKTMLRRKISD